MNSDTLRAQGAPRYEFLRVALSPPLSAFDFEQSASLLQLFLASGMQYDNAARGKTHQNNARQHLDNKAHQYNKQQQGTSIQCTQHLDNKTRSKAHQSNARNT